MDCNARPSWCNEEGVCLSEAFTNDDSLEGVQDASCAPLTLKSVNLLG